jgi:hypothetical protein
MCTCGLLGEVVGRAAALCHTRQFTPQTLARPEHVGELQQRLQASGCYIPRQQLDDPARGALVTTSSELALDTLAPNGKWHALNERMAIILPIKAGKMLPEITFRLRATAPTTVTISLLGSERSGNFTPECQYDAVSLCVDGERDYRCAFNWRSERDRYLFVAFSASEGVEIALTDARLPGMMTVFNSLNARVAKHTRQVADGDYGVDEFDFWLPRRYPQQIFPALRLNTPLRCYRAENLLNGRLRPEQQTNAWSPAADDPAPQVVWRWEHPQEIRTLTLVQDNDFDNAMETVQMGHALSVTPHCITHYRLWADGLPVAEVTHNHHSVCEHRFSAPLSVREIKLEIVATAGKLPAVYSLNVR